jgi:hypothetical protein
MTNRISNRDYEALSAYLDGELTPNERSRLESRLLAQAELRTALQELRQTRQVLRAQARIRRRRSFTLTPEMVGAYRPRQSGLRLFPVFGLTSALATMALVVTIAFGFLNGPGSTPVAYGPQTQDLQMEAVPAAEESSEPSSMKAAPETSQETPADASALRAFAPTPTPDMGILAAPPPGMGGGGDAGTGSAAAAEPLPPQEFPAPTSITETLALSVPMQMAEATALPRVDGATPEVEISELQAAPAATPDAALKSEEQALAEPSMDASRESLAQESSSAERDSAVSWWTPLHILQVLLGGLVLVSGLAALFFWILEKA